MTTSFSQAKQLVELATEKQLNLMVGHIYLHNSGIERMPIPVGPAALYIQLLNDKGGPSTSPRDVAWASLPHAISLALHFFPDLPEEVMAERTEHRIKALFRYWNGSKAYLDVGDFADRKLRKVELRVGNARYFFDATSPNVFLKCSGVVSTQVVCVNREPLMAECKAFLEYQGVDIMGPKVVKLIEEIMGSCKLP